jgi:hypothetical protein
MFHTLLVFNPAVIGKTIGLSLGTFKQNNSLSDIGQHWTEKGVHFISVFQPFRGSGGWSCGLSWRRPELDPSEIDVLLTADKRRWDKVFFQYLGYPVSASFGCFSTLHPSIPLTIRTSDRNLGTFKNAILFCYRETDRDMQTYLRLDTRCTRRCPQFKSQLPVA